MLVASYYILGSITHLFEITCNGTIIYILSDSYSVLGLIMCLPSDIHMDIYVAKRRKHTRHA